MKAKELLFKGLLFGTIFLTGFGLFYNQPEKIQTREEIRIEKVLENEEVKIDVAKLELERNISNAKNFIGSINSKVELKLINITDGNYKITIDRNPQQSKVSEFFTDSKVTVQLKYHTSLDIPVEYINLNVDESNGVVMVNYSLRDINCSGVVIDSYSVDETDKAMFGKPFSKQEIIGIIENGSSNITRDINKNEELKQQAIKSLEAYLKNQAKSMGVKSINFNGKYTETLNSSSNF